MLGIFEVSPFCSSKQHGGRAAKLNLGGRYLFRRQAQNARILSRSGPVAGQQQARAAARHPRLASESSGPHPQPARVTRLARIAAAARLCSLRPGRRRKASLLRLAGLGGRRQTRDFRVIDSPRPTAACQCPRWPWLHSSQSRPARCRGNVTGPGSDNGARWPWAGQLERFPVQEHCSICYAPARLDFTQALVAAKLPIHESSHPAGRRKPLEGKNPRLR